MDKLRRRSFERVDAFTLREQEWALRVRAVVAGEKVRVRGEREDEIWERDGVDASERERRV